MKFTARVDFSGLNKVINKRGLRKYGKTQMFIDSEVLRVCDPYVPKRSGTLKESGNTFTVPGSGEVEYNTPYAKRQHRENAGRGEGGTRHGGLRGKHWFERAMIDHKDDILEGAAKVAGGRRG